MDINIGTTNTDSSNEFLKSLWSQMAKEFGKCGWYYTPYKVGKLNKIFFGYMDINQESAIGVSVSYKEKGSINNISFMSGYEDEEINKGTELYERLKNVVNNAKKNIGKITTRYYSTVFHSFYPLYPYRNETYNFESMTNGNSQFSVGIKAYDTNQARGQLIQKCNQVMDFLSVETNSTFEFSEKVDSEFIDEITDQDEIYQEEDFIDGSSRENGYYVISKEAKDFIKKLSDTEEEVTYELNLLLKACSHFHSARKQEKQMVQIDSNGYAINKATGDETELATTLYLSALEVVTLIGFKEERCNKCGQPKFQITKRVRDFTSKYLPQHLVKDFIDYYDKRSKYLHVGMKLNTETPSNSLIPLLDPEDKSGCDTLHKVPLINIREYVSYCLRNFYRTYFV